MEVSGHFLPLVCSLFFSALKMAQWIWTPPSNEVTWVLISEVCHSSVRVCVKNQTKQKPKKLNSISVTLPLCPSCQISVIYRGICTFNLWNLRFQLDLGGNGKKVSHQVSFNLRLVCLLSLFLSVFSRTDM